MAVILFDCTIRRSTVQILLGWTKTKVVMAYLDCVIV